MAKSKRARDGSRKRAKSRVKKEARETRREQGAVVESTTLSDVVVPAAIMESADRSARKRTVTADTNLSTQSGVSANTLSTDSTVGPLTEGGSSGSDRIDPGDTEDAAAFPTPSWDAVDKVDAFDAFHPSVYSCTGYDIVDYEWFSGLSVNTDQRFLIDLKLGTMDRLPDVRPFLYHVGYFHGDRMSLSSTMLKQIEGSASQVVEDYFVKAGREFLLAKHVRGSSGYFLADRDWSKENFQGRETMPYVVCVNLEAMEGDVGFGEYHNPDAEIALAGDVLQTNLRTPLPLEIFVKTRPGDKDWDGFIIWLYTCMIHPAYRLNDSHWEVDYIHEYRAMEDWLDGEKYLTSAASEYY